MMTAVRAPGESQLPRTGGTASRPVRGFALLAACLLYFSSTPSAHSPGQDTEAKALRLKAFDLAYNLDHDAAVALLKRAVELAPEDPAAHRSLASVLWLNMLFKRGSVTVDTSDRSPRRRSRCSPPELDGVDRTSQQRSPGREARQRGAEGSAGPLIWAPPWSSRPTSQRSKAAAWDSPRSCLRRAREGLALGPSVDAGLIVGTYYVISSLAAGRMMAYVAPSAGKGGDPDAPGGGGVAQRVHDRRGSSPSSS